METDERWVWVPFEVDKKFDGYRIDRFLAQRLAGYSRSKVQRILCEARVHRGEKPAKANTKVRTGETIQIAYLRRPEKPLDPGASIPILLEDHDLVIVNKPGDLLSHPTDRVAHHTVLGYLRHSRPDLPKLHLLHRLDRETTGVIALAKNPRAARRWSIDMEKHRVRKEYVAFVRGVIEPTEGVIDLPIGRQGGDIKVRQWVSVPRAVPAVTKYRVIHRFVPGTKNQQVADLCLAQICVVKVFPETGRLHQIRVHFAAIGHPVVGDPLYTGEGEIYRKLIAGKCTEEDRLSLGFHRVALHAVSLTFPHPTTKKEVRVVAPLPEDMTRLISDKLMPLG
jgi:23S rRNA pseudouridine1911/1915/1917 synthase